MRKSKRNRGNNREQEMVGGVTESPLHTEASAREGAQEMIGSETKTSHQAERMLKKDETGMVGQTLDDAVGVVGDVVGAVGSTVLKPVGFVFGAVELGMMTTLKKTPFLGGAHHSIKDPPQNYDWSENNNGISGLEDVMLSKEVQLLKTAKGEKHQPSPKLLMWLAAKKTRSPHVTPECVAYAPDTIEEHHAVDKGDGSYTCGHESLAAKVFKWSYESVDIPPNIILEQHNIEQRVRIADLPLLDPDCPFRQCWDILQMLMLCYLAIELPMKTGFSLPDPELWSFGFCVEFAFDAYFIMDVYFSFVTCVYDEEGKLVTSRRIITAQYCKGWFFLDLISVLPFGYLPYFVDEINSWTSLPHVPGGGAGSFTSDMTDVQGDAERARLIKLLKLMRLIKLLRLARLKRLVDKYESQFYTLFQKLKAFKMMIYIVLFGHWLACVWFWVGTAGGDGTEGWVVQWADGKYSIDGYVATLDDVTLDESYLVTYWMAIGTLISGAVPTNIDEATVPELVFGMIAIVTGGFVYGNIVASITDLTRKGNMESDIADLKKAEARSMMRGRADKFLQQRIMQAINYNLDATPVLDIIGFMDALPSELQTDFAAQLGWIGSASNGVVNYGQLHKVPFFTHLDNRSQVLICDRMLVQYFDPFDRASIRAEEYGGGRRITTEGHPGGDMYIILSGKIQVQQAYQKIGTLETHHFFSEYCILLPQHTGSYGQLHSRTHYAIDGPAVVASLNYEEFQKLRRTRPEINDVVQPYIRESLGRELRHYHWFYLVVEGANDLLAKDAVTCEMGRTSDPYVVVFLNGDQIAKTPIQFKTVNPRWEYGLCFTRCAEHSYGIRNVQENVFISPVDTVFVAPYRREIATL
jgi:hypothetical protein